MSEKHKRHRLNVLGPFYVVDGCCLACRVPELIAPDLFGEDSDAQCFVKRQPENGPEIDAMMKVMLSQEVDCIRYAGTDDALLRRITENDGAGLCDVPPPRSAIPLRRDHVVFSAKPSEELWTPRGLLESLVLFAARWRATAIFDDGTTATVSITWHEDNYHRLEALASHQPGEWLVRHRGPVLMGDTIHRWLMSNEAFAGVRWQTQAQWNANGPAQPTPW